MERRIVFMLGFLLLMAFGCSNDIEPPNGSSDLPQKPETPRGLTAAIGDGQIRLDWTVNNPSRVDHYIIYFSDESITDLDFLDSTAATNYTVGNLVNGNTYIFRISAVDKVNHLEGDRSQAITATPGIFAMAINNGAKFTNTRNVTVNMTTPGGTSLVQVSEDSNFSDAYWRNASSAVSFELSDGDGNKTVFARFQMSGGSISLAVANDDIILDRYAVIDSVTESSGGAVLAQGDTANFAVYTSETGGTSSVSVTGIGTITLNDLGLGGDAAAGDGIYSVDYVFQIGTELAEAEVLGRFTDAAGNQAVDVKASTRINVNNLPEPVTLSGYEVSSSELLLEWTQATASDFLSYRVFRGTTAGVNLGDKLIKSISNKSTLSYSDTALSPSTNYYYKVYVFDQSGNSAESNEIALSTQVNDPPQAVTLAGTPSGDTLRVSLTWSQAAESDFKEYQLLRDTSPLGAYNSNLVISIFSSRTTTTYTDRTPANGTFYYQVYVVDKQGAKTGSNVVTVNVP